MYTETYIMLAIVVVALLYLGTPKFLKNLSDSVLGRLGMLVFVYFMAVYHGVNAGLVSAILVVFLLSKNQEGMDTMEGLEDHKSGTPKHDETQAENDDSKSVDSKDESDDESDDDDKHDAKHGVKQEEADDILDCKDKKNKELCDKHKCTKFYNKKTGKCQADRLAVERHMQAKPSHDAPTSKPATEKPSSTEPAPAAGILDQQMAEGFANFY
jgi:hypothetical protein